MRREWVVTALSLALFTEPARAAAIQQEITWDGLLREVAQRRLAGKRVRVSLTDGKAVGTVLRGIVTDSLLVEPARGTERRWRAEGKLMRIPRSEVAGLRFSGRQGRGGLIGGLIGLGLMGAITGAAASSQTEGGAAGVGILVGFPVFGLLGYLIGRTTDKQLPRYRIVE